VSRHLFAALGLAAFTSANAAAVYPFPFVAPYPYGTKASNADNVNLQYLFDAWKTNYYTENGDKARIKWTDPNASGSCSASTGNCTVSEGIGYGMLITVYMDNATNNTQPMFDKLWNYYSGNLDNKGLMNWKLNGFNGVVSGGAASDADIDVALALCMAYKQWGTQKYKDNAISVLGKIWSSETGSNAFTPDDQGTGNLFNPSYFGVGAARVFAQVDNSHNWGSIADGCLSKLSSIQAKYSTGLVPDWVDGNNSAVDHNGTGTGKFGYDAVRTPWRVALDYFWFGTANSKTFLSKIATWIKGANSSFSGVRAEYNLDGTTKGNYSNTVYDGAMVFPVMAAGTDSVWVRQGTKRIQEYGSDGISYYNDCWQILYVLTLSGNFQNFWGPVNAIQPRGARNPLTWTSRLRPGALDLQGKGSIEARLLDPSGRLLSHAAGRGSLSLARPSGPGVYFVRISGDENATFAVVAQ